MMTLESYCVLEELEPDKTYKVWVMAVNYTGCSLPSDRLQFTTGQSIIYNNCLFSHAETELHFDTLFLWQLHQFQSSTQSTALLCGIQSISGIKHCEQKVLLQPSEKYLFYIKAVNEAGASEQSEVFHLLKASAHPALGLSVDHKTLHFPQDTYKIMPVTENQCPSVLGELLSARGCYYWETNVSRSTAYRLGVAYSTTSRESSLGENTSSWCLQCVITPVLSTVLVIDTLERVGTLARSLVFLQCTKWTTAGFLQPALPSTMSPCSILRVAKPSWSFVWCKRKSLPKTAILRIFLDDFFLTVYQMCIRDAFGWSPASFQN
uniref:Fibronectin type-III domain-containing protein n=1 Tax=Cynoglossus semilaevis TaxID=244447 RepID=A0A3P8W4X1_CYNSE